MQYPQTYSWEVASASEWSPGHGRPQGVDARADRRRGRGPTGALAGRAKLSAASREGARRVRGPQQLPDSHPHHAARRRHVLRRGAARRLSGWSPASRTRSSARLRGPARAPMRSRRRAIRARRSGVHPLERFSPCSADLEGWHAGERQREAAFEARLERLRRLHGAFTENEDGPRSRATSRRACRRWRTCPGRDGHGAARRVPRMDDEPATSCAPAPSRRRATRLSGLDRRQRCRAIVARSRRPTTRSSAMRSDGPGRRSILVTHKNVGRLTFRAFAWICRPAGLAARGSTPAAGTRRDGAMVATRSPPPSGPRPCPRRRTISRTGPSSCRRCTRRAVPRGRLRGDARSAARTSRCSPRTSSSATSCW